MKINAYKLSLEHFGFCQLNKLVGSGVNPPKDFMARKGSGSSTSSLAIAIVVSSDRIGLELVSDYSAKY